MLREVITCAPLATPKPYLGALCRLLAGLSVNTELDLRGLAALAEHALGLLSDRAQRKDVAAFATGLGRAVRAAEPLAPEDIELLLASIRQYDGQDTFLGDYPLPFEVAEGGEEGAPPGTAPTRGSAPPPAFGDRDRNLAARSLRDLCQTRAEAAATGCTGRSGGAAGARHGAAPGAGTVRAEIPRSPAR